MALTGIAIGVAGALLLTRMLSDAALRDERHGPAHLRRRRGRPANRRLGRGVHPGAARDEHFAGARLAVTAFRRATPSSV